MVSSKLPDWALKMAPCLVDSAYADEAAEMVAAALRLPQDNQPYTWLTKVTAAHTLLQMKLFLEDHPEVEPLAYYRAALLDLARSLDAAAVAKPAIAYPLPPVLEEASVEGRTAHHYGTLFARFDESRYYDEPRQLLAQRLERNDFPLDKFPQWRALDAGCGNGRYTLALKQLGMREVVGLDLSPLNIENAEQRLKQRSFPGVSFKQGSLLNIPFEDDTFDFTFCNGVAHHTADYDKTVFELLRVTKKGGCGFFHVMADPGGIHWDNYELMRILLKDVDYGYAQQVLVLLGVPPHRIFLTLDHAMAPINIRRTREQVADLLKRAGASVVRWCERGCDADGTERIHNGQPHAEILFGIGENRFYFEKAR